MTVVRHGQELDRLQFLQARSAVDDRLHQLTAAGTGLSGWVAAAAELTGKPVTLFDRRRRTVAGAGSGPDRAADISIRGLLGTQVPRDGVEPVLIQAGAVRGPVRRALAVPVTAGGESFGWLVIEEYRHSFVPLDDFVARRIAVRLGAEFAVQRRVAKVAWNARSALARQLVHGSSDPRDLLASGEYLGVDVRSRRILVYLKHSETTRIEEDALAAGLERRLDTEVLSTKGSEGTLLLVAVDRATAPAGAVAAVTSAVRLVLDETCPDGTVVAGVSGVAEADGLQRAYREAREVGLCIDRFARPGGHRVLAVGDLGPARLFLAHSGSAGVQSYVDDLIGPLLDGRPNSRDLLETLQHYFDAGRSIRVAAGRLGLHENTVRLRLGRVLAATGLDVAGDATDQLSVQTALLVLRLQGHPALPTMEPTAATVEADGSRRTA